MRHKQEVRAELLLCPLSKECLFVRVEVMHVRNVLELLHCESLGVLEADGGDGVYGRYIRMEEFNLGCIFSLEKVHDVLESSCLHVHDICEIVYEAHLKVHGDVLVEVPVGVKVLCAEHRANLKDALKDGNQHLLVELGALRKENCLAEVLEAEHVGAALCAGEVDFRRVDFGKALAGEILTEASLHAFLELEDGTLRGVAESYRTVVQVY